MNIKELRKMFPAPFALSVLKRALEINSDVPDVETAVKEYASEMSKRPTRYDFYYAAPCGTAQLFAGKVSAETEKYRPVYGLLLAQKNRGALEQKDVDKLMAAYGEHIKVYPTKTYALKGQLNNYFDTAHYLSIVGVDTVPAIPRSELTDEILITLAKNILSYHMDYEAQKEGWQESIKRLEKVAAERRDPKIRRKLDDAKKSLAEMPPFEEFFLTKNLEFGDSIVAKTYSVFSSDKTIQEYMKIATKKLADTLRTPITEFKIVQCEVYDLAD